MTRAHRARSWPTDSPHRRRYAPAWNGAAATRPRPRRSRAAPGTPIDPDDKLHRIDPAAVRKQVESAGFKFEGESTLLRNPADDHTKTVFDPSIRGHTDQFIYKFRKPK